MVITGAAGGIGLAVACRLDRAGARLLLFDRDEDGLRKAAAALPSARCVTGDITSATDLDRLRESAESEWEGLDGLVHAAAVGEGGLLADLTNEVWNRVLETNLTAAFQVTRGLLPALRRSRGAVVQVASLAGLVASPGMGVYAAAKAGLIQLVRVLALEEARHGVRVNAVCPAWVETPMLDRYLNGFPEPDRQRRRLEHLVPLGRLAQPEDVAAAIHFLISPDAGFITGTAFPVDGGMACR